MTNKIDIHIINGKYYNYNGRNPDKPLSIPYAKRLISAQKRYGDLVSIKEASGHGKLNNKKDIYIDILKKKKSKKSIKKGLKDLNKSNISEFQKKIKEKKIQTGNLRTRFRSGFRVYNIDDDGNEIDEYDTISYHKALDGFIPFNRFIKELGNECFNQNAHGGFRYVVYDKETKKVYYDYSYDTDDTDN